MKRLRRPCRYILTSSRRNQTQSSLEIPKEKRREGVKNVKNVFRVLGFLLMLFISHFHLQNSSCMYALCWRILFAFPFPWPSTMFFMFTDSSLVVVCRRRCARNSLFIRREFSLIHRNLFSRTHGVPPTYTQFVNYFDSFNNSILNNSDDNDSQCVCGAAHWWWLIIE